MRGEIGRVTRLFRYPIKSVGGEEIQYSDVTERGFKGDRFWAVEDEEGKFGSGKSTRRFRQMSGLLDFRARYEGDVPLLILPDDSGVQATSAEATAQLRQHTGKNVSVQPERDISHFDEGAVHFITTSALALLEKVHGEPVDLRRLRPNLILDTGTATQHLEESWVGQQLTLGDTLVLEVAYLMPRCVMVNLPQHKLSEDKFLLKSIARINPEARFGALARVVRGGSLRLGDSAQFLKESPV